MIVQLALLTAGSLPVVNEPANTDSRRRTLEAIHDAAVDAIVTINDRGLIETVNPAVERLFGYTPDELIGHNVSVLMPSPYHDEHDGYLQNYHRTGQKKIIGIGREVSARRKDGTVFPIHLAVSEVQLEGRRVFAGFVRDLSDLKLVQQQEATLGRIIEDSLNEVFIFDAETLKFIQVNRGARDNLGYTMDELRELTPLDIKPSYTREQFQNEFLDPLQNQEVNKLNFRTQHHRKDGTIYDVDINMQLANYLTKPVFVAIILDISERLAAEQQAHQQQMDMRAELERLVQVRTQELRDTQSELVRNEKFSTLGKVSGGIAHEIRNPLNAAKMSAYYLLNVTEPPAEKVREHLERIDRQVSMIDNVVTALSDVAKLPEVTLVPTAMEPLLQSVVGSVNLSGNVEVVFDLAAPLPPALVDEQQISIAFRNLIRNARDAMPEGGTITISAVAPDDQQVVYSVADTGVGISPSDLPHVLEPLYTTKARGMGLGLSIAKEIVVKNQGVLSVDSELGRGSVFHVTLRQRI